MLHTPAFHIQSLQKITYITAVSGLCWKLAASPHSATRTFCSGQKKHFGGADEGCCARMGETTGGPRSPHPHPLAPRTGLLSRSPAEQAGAGSTPGEGVLTAAGGGRDRPAGAAAGEAERAELGAVGPGLPRRQVRGRDRDSSTGAPEAGGT